MDYVLLLFVIIHDRLLEKKRQEKKHEKKKFRSSFQYIHVRYNACTFYGWRTEKNCFVSGQMFTRFLWSVFTWSHWRPPFWRTKTVKRRAMWVKQANSLDSLEVELSQFLLRLSYIQSNLLPKSFSWNFSPSESLTSREAPKTNHGYLGLDWDQGKGILVTWVKAFYTNLKLAS